MSRGLNKAMLIGRVGKGGPQDSCSKDGVPISNFSLAIDRSWKDQNGQKVEETDWMNIVAFKSLADICNKYLKQGTLVYIEGRFVTDKYKSSNDGPDDPYRYSTKVIAREVSILTTKKESESGNQGEEHFTKATKKSYRNAKDGTKAKAMDEMEALHGDSVIDDEIPF
jgi:single-strand DNA-binding protein